MADEPETPEADATPDLNTVMQENAELRAALAHYVEGDLDEHLDSNISFGRDGSIRYQAPVSEPEGEEADGPSEDPSGSAPQTDNKPEVKPRQRTRNVPGRKAPEPKKSLLDRVNDMSPADFMENRAAIYAEMETANG